MFLNANDVLSCVSKNWSSIGVNSPFNSRMAIKISTCKEIPSDNVTKIKFSYITFCLSAASLPIFPSLQSCSSSVSFSRNNCGSLRPNNLITSGVRNA